jgi:multiple sugar transport system ATP-binding protein
MSSVKLNGVWKYYSDETAAVQDVNLSIESGEFVVLVGPSGCGKSTTLRMIAGLESISKGEIEINNKVVNNIQPKDRDIAMVFQNYALYPHMTVEKNIGFALKISGMSKDEIKKTVSKTSSILGLDSLLHRKPGALSGGQRQRVALGRAIARDPAVYLFDEPLSNLDAKLRVTMRSELKALHRRLGTTTVYVTHDQEEAMTLGSRLVVMANGKVQQIGTPLDVYNNPVNKFVASFVGSPTMNFIDGTIKSTPDGHAFCPERSSVRIALSRPQLDRFGVSEGKQVCLGFRPHSITFANDSTQGVVLDATVDFSEPMGDRVDLRLSVDEYIKILARMPLDTVPTNGDRIQIKLALDSMMLFEPSDFGVRL